MSSQATGGQSSSTMRKVPELEIVRPRSCCEELSELIPRKHIESLVIYS